MFSVEEIKHLDLVRKLRGERILDINDTNEMADCL